MKIKRISAEIINNSLGQKTVEVNVNKNFKGSAPLGLSRGSREVFPYPVEGVSVGVVNNTLHKCFKGFRVDGFKDLEIIEETIFKLDESKELTKIGGNVVIAFENALLKAAASGGSVWKFLNPRADEMPIPVGECVGGGKHDEDGIEIQEFLTIPHGDSFKENAYINHHIYSELQRQLHLSQRTRVGSWSTTLDVLELLDVLKKHCDSVVEKFGISVDLGLDVAGSHICNGEYYFYKKGKLDRMSQIKYINLLISKYHLEYVEDPLNERDADGYKWIKGEMICGDDLVGGSLERLKEVAGKINTVVISPSHVGSLLKTKELIDFAKKENIVPVLSHRAGETMDTTLADLAVAWGVPYIKCGVFGKERLAKINRLREIEKEII